MFRSLNKLVFVQGLLVAFVALLVAGGGTSPVKVRYGQQAVATD